MSPRAKAVGDPYLPTYLHVMPLDSRQTGTTMNTLITFSVFILCLVRIILQAVNVSPSSHLYRAYMIFYVPNSV